MHVRVATMTGVTDVDAGVAFARDTAVPRYKELKGFRGLTMNGDRSSGTVGVLTLWETEEDLRSSEAVTADVRTAALELMGGQATVETYEQMVSEVGDPAPAPGCALRIRSIKMDPARVEENAAFFMGNVVPEMKATPGFRAVRNLMNRSTGEGVVGTVWNDTASMEAAEQQAEQRRQAAASRGVEFRDSATREVLFSALA